MSRLLVHKMTLTRGHQFKSYTTQAREHSERKDKGVNDV